MKARFLSHDGPTWLVALVLYGAWAALIAGHARLPWWIVTPIGAYLVAWHFSLQHEAIHAFRSAPDWLRTAVVMPPLGLWLPFPLYREAHTTHHRNTHLTEPGVDTESVYWRAADWDALPAWRRAVLRANQTLLGRVVIGPVLRLEKLVLRETARIAAGDRSHVHHWIVHALLVGLLFVYISGVCAMPWWQYVFGIAWPAFGLGWVRSFIEHRYGPRPAERTAIVESNAFWSLLFLNNNLHAVHHLHPRMPWWEIPAYYRANRERILARNGHFHFRGYAQIARRWGVRPAFEPVHPRS
ncbi:MAG: fatty acid desaturase [Lautropia sp.]